MCGIFGGIGVTENQVKDGIDLIKRGDDGITITKLEDETFFKRRRHLVKKSGKDSSKFSDQPYFSQDKKISLIFNGEFYNFQKYKKLLLDQKFHFFQRRRY